MTRYTASGDAADPSSGLAIMTIAQPFSNHNGGQITFGADGMLYVALGDGGSAGDPLRNGQNTATLLGSLLRIDVDNPDPGMNYGIPADNPFAGSASARGEIWIYGLRNPWRFAFDDMDGLLYVADVGQNRFEEVTFRPCGRRRAQLRVEYHGGDELLQLRHLRHVRIGHAGPCSTTTRGLQETARSPGAMSIAVLTSPCCRVITSTRTFVAVSCGAFGSTSVLLQTSGTGDSLLEVWTSFGEDVAGELYMLVAEGSVFKIVAAQ